MSKATIDSTEKYFRDMQRRIDWHVWAWERIQARTPAEHAAWRVIDTMCDDPEMWATHGMPPEHKLERLARLISLAIEAAR